MTQQQNLFHSDSIPLIFVHNGNQLYLKYALINAFNTQKDSKIYLLTDKNKNSFSAKDFPKKMRERIIIIDSSLYNRESNNFSTIYKHMSPNSKEFELICFYRWFIIKSFALENNIEKFFCCDSDTLVFNDLTQIALTRLNGKEISIVNKICPCCTYFTKQSIQLFCNFIITQYTDKQKLQKLENIYKEKIESNLGGICDMTMFPLYEEAFPNSIHDFGNIVEIQGKFFVFNDNISITKGFVEKNSIKKIKFIKKIPYGFSTDNKIVCFDILHCQGIHKYYIGKYGHIPLILKIQNFFTYFSLNQYVREHMPKSIKKLLKRFI